MTFTKLPGQPCKLFFPKPITINNIKINKTLSIKLPFIDYQNGCVYGFFAALNEIFVAKEVFIEQEIIIT